MKGIAVPGGNQRLEPGQWCETANSQWQHTKPLGYPSRGLDVGVKKLKRKQKVISKKKIYIHNYVPSIITRSIEREGYRRYLILTLSHVIAV